MCQICNLVLRYRSNQSVSFNTRNLTTTILSTATCDREKIQDRDNFAQKKN